MTMRPRNCDGQMALDFDAPPPLPPTQLDADGHLWWARLATDKIGECISSAAKWPQHERELDGVARVWKQFKALHERRAEELRT